MRFLFLLLTIFIMSSPIYAANGQSAGRSGGFTGPVSGAAAETAREAKLQPDGSRVVVTGNIISRLAGSKDEYMFKDSTGEILVKIGPKLFRGLELTPDNTVRMSGRMDKKQGREDAIDVKVIEVLN